MIRTLGLCLALAACATAPTRQAPPLGVALACASEAVLICPTFGCTAAQPGETRRGSVAVEVPAFSQFGQLCEEGRCQQVRVQPTLTNALGWTADLYTGREFDQRYGEVEVGSERTSFHWRVQSNGSLYVWRGLCQAAGS